MFIPLSGDQCFLNEGPTTAAQQTLACHRQPADAAASPIYPVKLAFFCPIAVQFEAVPLLSPQKLTCHETQPYAVATASTIGPMKATVLWPPSTNVHHPAVDVEAQLHLSCDCRQLPEYQLMQPSRP